MTISQLGYVLISYSRLDDAVMRRVVTFMRRQGIKVWVDNEKLVPGTPIWEKEIEKAIRGTAAVVVLLSPDLNDSVWVQRELGFAERYHKRIFPVLVAGDEYKSIPLRLVTNQYVDIRERENEKAGLKSLLTSLSDYLENLSTLEKEKKEIAEKVAREKAQKEAAQKVAQEKAEKEAAEKTAQEMAEQEAVDVAAREKAKREKAKLQAARRALLVKIFREFIEFLKKYRKITLLSVVSTVLLIILGVILFSQIFTPPFLFFCGSKNNAHVCEYTKNKDEIKAVSVLDEAINWAPVRSLFGGTYFTSDRDGSAEIYRLKNSGEVERVTNTVGGSKSWSPAIRYDGTLYFTSNRSGKAEIYRFNRNGDVERVTNTPGKYESWSPVVGFGNEIYFTSDRAGKAEIYRLNQNGDVERVTNTPAGYVSWAPAYMLGGDIYFTSNRNGKSEIYRLIRNGGVERVTNTTGVNGSWAPIVRGRNVYFTSSRSGQTEVYLLKAQVISILSFEGWTNISERSPMY